MERSQETIQYWVHAMPGCLTQTWIRPSGWLRNAWRLYVVSNRLQNHECRFETLQMGPRIRRSPLTNASPRR